MPAVAMIGRLLRAIAGLMRTLARALDGVTGPPAGRDPAMAALSERFPGAPEHWLKVIAQRAPHLADAAQADAEGVAAPPAAPRPPARLRLAWPVHRHRTEPPPERPADPSARAALSLVPAAARRRQTPGWHTPSDPPPRGDLGLALAGDRAPRAVIPDPARSSHRPPAGTPGAHHQPPPSAAPEPTPPAETQPARARVGLQFCASPAGHHRPSVFEAHIRRPRPAVSIGSPAAARPAERHWPQPADPEPRASQDLPPTAQARPLADPWRALPAAHPPNGAAPADWPGLEPAPPRPWRGQWPAPPASHKAGSIGWGPAPDPRWPILPPTDDLDAAPAPAPSPDRHAVEQELGRWSG